MCITVYVVIVLVAMRIHDVTPEYINNLRSRGMQNLTIDQLVSMRIHGLD
jgi:hypothetical protein